MNNDQSNVIQQLFDIADNYDANTFDGKRELTDSFYKALKHHNPNIDDHKLHVTALTLSYIYIHDMSDDRHKQYDKFKEALNE